MKLDETVRELKVSLELDVDEFLRLQKLAEDIYKVPNDDELTEILKGGPTNPIELDVPLQIDGDDIFSGECPSGEEGFTEEQRAELRGMLGMAKTTFTYQAEMERIEQKWLYGEPRGEVVGLLVNTTADKEG